MEQYARNFTEFCYPGIKDYSLGKPMIIWSERIKQKSFNQNEEVLLFCVYRVTNVINDCWEIKAYTFFLIKKGLIYFIAEEIANYEQEVIISNGQSFDFESEKVSLGYSVKNLESFKQVVVPRSKWKLVELILEITNIPEGDAPETIRKQFVGEKFFINLRDDFKLTALRKNDFILIPRGDVIKTLTTSKKIDLIYSLPEQASHISFNHGCYKIY